MKQVVEPHTCTIEFARSFADAHRVFRPSSFKILLTEDELRTIEIIAGERNRRAYEAKAKPAHGWVPTSVEADRLKDVDGVRGELVVAKFFGFALQDTHYYEDNDVFGYGVRASRHNSAHLIIYAADATHTGDADRQPFILVTGKGPEQFIRGWLFGFEGKGKPSRSPYGRGGSWNKQDELRPIETLPDLIGP